MGPATNGCDPHQTVTNTDKSPGATSYKIDGAMPSTAPCSIIAEIPVISPASGTYNAVQSVTITDSTPNAIIRYTIDGSRPTISSSAYTGPIRATTNTTIQAIATTPNASASTSVTAQYTIVAPSPAITPTSGTFTNTATVTMSEAIPGATIHYTSDGSSPTTSSPIYTGPMVVAPQKTSTEVFRALAIASGYLQSSSTMVTFTVTAQANVLAQSTVNSTPQMTIPPNFMGLSADWHTPTEIMGQASTGVNDTYRTLLRNLTAYYTVPMLFRIEGDNSQASDLEGCIEPLTELAQAVNVNYTLGVDLMNNNVSVAEAEASAWMNGIPNGLIQAIEIGNEPDVYPYNGARPSSYDFPEYLAQFQQWKQGIQSATSNNFGVMGPSYGGSAASAWETGSQSALAAGTLRPVIVSQHAYLPNPAPGHTLPADYLLLPYSAVGMPVFYSKYATSAHQAGRIFRMGEINSLDGGGVAGISNSFSSALWSIDVMFNYLTNGMDGVNWHSGQYTRYALFEFSPITDNSVTTFPLSQVNPIYYGLLVFAQMAGRDAKLLPVTTTTVSNVSIWATVDNTSTTHVIVINKDETATGNVEITLPGYTTGTVRYLSAAHYSATNGVTLGGQTFDGSTDGTFQGSPTSTTITAQDGKFTLSNMPVTTAAVIDFSN